MGDQHDRARRALAIDRTARPEAPASGTRWRIPDADRPPRRAESSSKLRTVAVAAVAAAANACAAPPADRHAEPLDDTGVKPNSAPPPPPGDGGVSKRCTDGAERVCGVEYGKHDGQIDCAQGVQVCKGGEWGQCVVESSLGMRTVREGRLTALTYAGSSATDCTGDPCNPYCRDFDDAPDAAPKADAGSLQLDTLTAGPLRATTVPSGFQDKGTLDEQCASPCTGQSCLEACQFDQHCMGGSCIPYDGRAKSGCSELGGGIDITVPTTCGSNSGHWRGITVCNRGDATAPPGIQCMLYPGDSPQFPNATPDGGTYIGQTQGSLPPGDCETFFVPEWAFPNNGTESLMCNPPGGVTECNPYNNWSATKANPADRCQYMTSGAPITLTRVFQATCTSPTQLPVWQNFLYGSSVPVDGRIEFRFRSFAPASDGTCLVKPPIVSGTSPAPLATAGPVDPAVCVIGNDPACPKSFVGYLPQTTLPCLQMDAYLVPGATMDTTLYEWLATFDCPPSM